MPSSDKAVSGGPAPVQLLLASSNPGKLREYRMLASCAAVELALMPNFREIPAFEENAPTFAENASGKAEYYSRFADEIVLADDSGLVVPALGGAPGVQSARYAGPDATDADRVQKLLREMEVIDGANRFARFICATAIAKKGRLLAVASGSAEGSLTRVPQGSGGFGYDPIFLFEKLGRTFAEATREEKNQFSHRALAFRRILEILSETNSATFVSPSASNSSV